MQAAGLHMRDLFSGRPLTPAQARQAEKERKRREVEALVRRRRRGLLADQYRTLNDLIGAIAPRLMEMQDSAEGEALTCVYHSAVEKVHGIETIYDRQESREFHRRLVRFCEKHRIDYQRLLAQYLPGIAEPIECAEEALPQ